VVNSAAAVVLYLEVDLVVPVTLQGFVFVATPLTHLVLEVDHLLVPPFHPHVEPLSHNQCIMQVQQTILLLLANPMYTIEPS